MKVLTSPASPFGRKVKITAQLKGVADQIDFQAMDAGSPDNQNPLSKIPVLITDDGTAIYDSPVICEYLDSLAASPVLFPPGGKERWEALTLAALGDGIIDAAILLVYEKRYRPEDKWVSDWTDRQQAKIDQALASLEPSPPPLPASPNYGHITLACALGYLDFRHEGKWRAANPNLVAWLDAFDKTVPAFAASAPPAA